MPLNTVALELVPPNADRPIEHILEEAHKIVRFCAETGFDDHLRHVLIPGMIIEDSDRPIEMKPKLDVLDYWSLITPELPGVTGLCTQVTAFTDEPALRRRITDLLAAGMEGIVFVGVPRTMSDGAGGGVAPSDALALYQPLVAHRGAILIPTRADECIRFHRKCEQGANFGMTQLLYSDAIIDFLTKFAQFSEYRPEIVLSFGFVPQVETRVGLIKWLIQDPGNPAVAGEQEFVAQLAHSEPAQKRRLLLDLYKRIIDSVGELGFPISIHCEATYGISLAACETFADMMAYWSPRTTHNASSERITQ